MGEFVTIGSLKRLSLYMAGQLKSAVSITGGVISGISSLTATKLIEGTETNNTSIGTLSNGGLSVVGSTLASTYTLSDPVAGVIKRIFFNTGSSLAQIITVGSSLVSIGAGTTLTKINATAAGQACLIEGVSTTKWALISANSTLVTLST